MLVFKRQCWFALVLYWFALVLYWLTLVLYWFALVLYWFKPLQLKLPIRNIYYLSTMHYEFGEKLCMNSHKIGQDAVLP